MNESQSPMRWFSPQMPVTARTGPVQSQEPELSLCLPGRWQGCEQLSHLLLSSQAVHWQAARSELKPGLEPGTGVQDVGIPSSILTKKPQNTKAHHSQTLERQRGTVKSRKRKPADLIRNHRCQKILLQEVLKEKKVAFFFFPAKLSSRVKAIKTFRVKGSLGICC